MEPLFLSLDEVREIHQQQIEIYGGSYGIRDAGALESAIATPQATFGGEFPHASVPAMAAAYLFRICQNHPFIDGNERASANAAITFLPNEVAYGIWSWEKLWKECGSSGGPGYDS
ncbi:MAG: Fic family protein [Acidobacteria bacterium]|nr:Fic family protein [Acidobacteriota bacterium]